MAKEVKWSPEAEDTFDQVIRYLEDYWIEKEITGFISATKKIITFISGSPYLFRKSAKKNIHEA